MAARENQGYLIAVIILVLLSLVLALVAFLGMSKASENAELLEAAQQKEKYYNSLAQAEALKGRILKAFIGYEGTIVEYDTMLGQLQSASNGTGLEPSQQEQIRAIEQEVIALKAQFDKDTEGQGTRDGDGVVKQATYREVQKNLVDLAAKKVKEQAIQVRETERTNEDAAQRIAQMQSTVNTTTEEMKKLRNDLEQEKKDSLAKQNELKDALSKSTQNLAQVTKESEEFRQTAEDSIRKLNKSIKDLTDENQIVKAKLNAYEREVFDNADGMITNVSNSLNRVFVDLGSEDGLMNNMTFSVYDKSVTNFDRSNTKAAIEIINVEGSKAQARITEMDPANPILPGDQILTPTWDPGYPTKIALYGLFDLDGDEVDDTEKLARMIERNGGVVIAKHDLEGNISGEIDPTTRYIVKGNADIIEGAAALTQAMKTLEQQADRNTVEPIDLQKLLNRMGVRKRPQTQMIGMPVRGLTPRPSLKSEDK